MSIHFKEIFFYFIVKRLGSITEITTPYDKIYKSFIHFFLPISHYKRWNAKAPKRPNNFYRKAFIARRAFISHAVLRSVYHLFYFSPYPFIQSCQAFIYDSSAFLSQNIHGIFCIYISSHDFNFFSETDAIVDLTHTNVHADISDLSEIFPSWFEDDPIGCASKKPFCIPEWDHRDTTAFTGFPCMIIAYSFTRSDIMQSHHSGRDSHRWFQFLAEHICLIIRV